MSDEREMFDEERRGRHKGQTSRPRSQRAAQSTGRKKKAGGQFGGAHQRRNKHWSW